MAFRRGTIWRANTSNSPAFVQQIYMEEQRRQKRLAAIAGDAQTNGKRQPMDPQALGELVNNIGRADLTNVLRRQAVCAIAPGDTPKPIYRELYISIPDLRDAVMPKRDIASDRWLFQYLTQTLDRRVLALLRRNDDSNLAHSYSLNLNISTLLSPEFQAFDQNLRSGSRGSIVIEIEKVDIFNDIGSYIFARDFVRERGYRICLDGVTALTLPFIDRERLGIDLVKVFWSPDLGDPARPERTRRKCARRSSGSANRASSSPAATMRTRCASAMIAASSSSKAGTSTAFWRPAVMPG